MCNQIPIYPPNILKTLAKTASFAILSFVLPSRWGTTALRQGTAAVQVRHCRSSVAALSRLNWPLGAGGIYTFSYLPQWSPIFQLDHSLLGATRATLSFSLTHHWSPSSFSLWSFPNPREFEPSNCITEHLIRVQASELCLLLLELAPSRLEHRP
jgi:hypothetical protein